MRRMQESTLIAIVLLIAIAVWSAWDSLRP